MRRAFVFCQEGARMAVLAHGCIYGVLHCSDSAHGPAGADYASLNELKALQFPIQTLGALRMFCRSHHLRIETTVHIICSMTCGCSDLTRRLKFLAPVLCKALLACARPR
jgi:hypothetical protein